MHQPIRPINRPKSPFSRAASKLPQRERFFAKIFLLLPLFLVMRVTLLVRQRSGAEFASVDSMAALQILIVCSTFALFLITPRAKMAWRGILNTSGRFLLLYYTVATLSCLWSGLPQYTLYRSIEFFSQFYAVYLAIFYSFNFLHAEKKVLLTSLIIILFGIGLHLKLSGFSFSLGALHTNSYSASAAMLFCYCLGEHFTAEKKRKRFLRNIGFSALFFLAIGTSSASNIAALAGIGVIAIFNRNKTLLVIAACGLVVAPFVLSAHDITSIIFPGKSDQAILTMTGRASIWEMYIGMIEAKPFLGYGFAASTRMAERYMTNTHNGYLAIVLGTGMLGMSVFLIACWQFIRESIRNQRRGWAGSTGCFAALTVGFTNNMAMSLIGEQWTPATMVFTLFFALHILLTTKSRT